MDDYYALEDIQYVVPLPKGIERSGKSQLVFSAVTIIFESFIYLARFVYVLTGPMVLPALRSAPLRMTTEARPP